MLDKAFDDSSKVKETIITDFMGDEWKEFQRADEKIMSKEVETKI